MSTKLLYGGEATSLQEAAAPLIQLAEGNGVHDKGATPLDLQAAVCGAQLWCSKYNTTTFNYPRVHGLQAVSELANILARAAGHRTLVINTAPYDAKILQELNFLGAQHEEDIALRVASDFLNL